MAHAENEVIINKPVPEVYSFLADGTNNTKWRPGVVSIELSSGQAGQEGALYKQTLKGPGGRNIDGDYKITVANPNNPRIAQRDTYSAEGPFPARSTFAFFLGVDQKDLG